MQLSPDQPIPPKKTPRKRASARIEMFRRMQFLVLDDNDQPIYDDNNRVVIKESMRKKITFNDSDEPVLKTVSP